MRYTGGYNIQEMMQKDTIAMNAGININLEMRELEYNLVYSKRKTLGICIKAPGIIIVRAPMHLPKEQIEKSLKNKSKWILQKLELLSKIDIASEVKLYEEKFMITTPVKDEEIIKESMQLWYKQKAREIVIEKIEYYSKYFQLMPNSIKIKAQKTRWGSCTYKNDLALNYKLIMAPPDVLDYVVVHEMCHMEHKNHSKNFWNRVSSIMIDYKEKRNWLKEHGGKL
jgi:predicted metal-dependent hydrolase